MVILSNMLLIDDFAASFLDINTNLHLIKLINQVFNSNDASRLHIQACLQTLKTIV